MDEYLHHNEHNGMQLIIHTLILKTGHSTDQSTVSFVFNAYIMQQIWNE